MSNNYNKKNIVSQKKKKPIPYVNNEKFFLELVRYKKKVEECKELGLPKPIIPDYIGVCIMQIAQKLSNSSNFIGYHFKDEMISDGIENCFLYLNNFDPDKTSNPFAYFTQIIWYAFIRRIQREKKQWYIKAKNLQALVLMDSLNAEIASDKIMPNEAMNELINSFESAPVKKKSKSPQGVEKFVSKEDE